MLSLNGEVWRAVFIICDPREIASQGEARSLTLTFDLLVELADVQ